MTFVRETLAKNSTIVVTWEANRRHPDAVKSNKTNLGTTDKIILVEPDYTGIMPRAGQTWVCQVDRVTSKSRYKGAILVKPVQQQIEYNFPGVWIQPEKAKLIACVLQDPRRNLMLVGPQGTGKTTISFAIAEALGWKFRKISGGLIKKAVYMLGRYIPKGEGESMTFVWADSKLSESLREAAADLGHTYLIMIDELPRVDEDARDVLLDIIEGKVRTLRLPTGEEIPIGRNVKFMAAGNLGEGFTTKRSDAAHDDRWEIIKIPYMPLKEELAHCLRLYPSCPKKQMEAAIEAINKVRQARLDSSQQLSRTVSTRRAEAIAMYLSNGFSLDEAMETSVANQFEGAVEDANSQSYKVLGIMKDAVARTK